MLKYVRIKRMLNQKPNSDGDPFLPIEHTYTHMIYATRTHHYLQSIKLLKQM